MIPANALMRAPQLGQIPGQGQFGSGFLPPGYAQPLGGANTQFPLNPGAYPPSGPITEPGGGFPPGVMQPGGGNAPPPQYLGPPTAQPPMQGGSGQPWNPQQQGRQDFRNALMDWRGLRPDHKTFDGTPQDWRTQMSDWHNQRPARFDPRSLQPSGFGGPPLPSGLAALPGGASQPPGVASIAPPNPYQLPVYGGG